MTDKSTLFSGDKPEEKPNEPANTNEGDSKANSQEPVLVYGDRLFTSKEEVLKKMVNADAFIEQLKEENEALRAEVTNKSTYSEELEGKLEMLNQTNQQQEPAQQPQGNTQPETLGAEQIAQLVEQTIANKEKTSALMSNLEKAKEAMVSKYGEKAQEVVLEKAKALSMTPEQVEQLASSSPDAFAKLLLDGGTVQGTPSSTSGGINSSAVISNQPKEEVKLYKLKGKELQVALKERAAKLSAEKGIPLY